MYKTLKPYAPAIVWGIFIFVLSTIPGKELPNVPNWIDILAFDKIVHMIFYSVLTWLILRVHPLSYNRVFKVLILCVGFGWFIEWFQERFSEGRLFEFLDGMANTIGALGVAVVYLSKNKILKNKKQSTNEW